MDVQEPTSASWLIASPRAAPSPLDGAQPVQLVPENARKDRGGTPVTVPSGMNQSLWFEVFVPKSTRPGRYRGIVRVVADKRERRIPVELTVRSFTLPDENPFPVMAYYEPEQVIARHGRNLDDRYHRFAHEHRIELVHGYTPETALAARPRFNGLAYTRRHGYQGPGEGVGDNILPASFYGPTERFRSLDGAPLAAESWMSFVHAVFPSALTFLYIADEPSRSQFDEISSLAGAIKSGETPGSELPIFLTSRYQPSLAGAVDLWAVDAAGVSPADQESVHARGARYWMYNGRRPETGALLIDTPASDARALIWSLMKARIDGYFYWHAVHWDHNAQKVGPKEQNVWANAITFDNRGQPGKPAAGQGFGNGDGVLLYPGEDLRFPDEDRGIPGPIGTVQLANLRRGLQDALYLQIAEALGLEDEVRRAYEEVVPRVLSEAGDEVGFAETAGPFEHARDALGAAIERTLRARRERAELRRRS